MIRPIRTVALDGTEAGATTGYWETAWAAEKQSVPPFLAHHLRTELAGRRLVLESGCGQAEVVRMLAGDGHLTIGVDLAGKALRRAHAADPTLHLSVGDVARLPFADGTFDAVVSLGVVEHFEDGPEAALREQCRVLAPGGLLFLTVPQRSWLRAATDTWHLGLRRRDRYRQRRRLVSRRPTTAAAADEPHPFHQYEFSRRQLLDLVADAGFTVRRWTALDVGSALTESRAVARLVAGGKAGDGAAEPTRTPAEAPPPEARGGLKGWGRAAVFGSDPGGPVTRLARAVATRALGHLQLVVATNGPDRG